MNQGTGKLAQVLHSRPVDYQVACADHCSAYQAFVHRTIQVHVATEALFQLHRLGYANLALYDGSMSEWARAPELPIERDPPESSAAG